MMIYGLSLLPVSLFMIIWQTTPFFTSVFGLFINKEKIQALEWVSMALCFAGVVIISMSNGDEKKEEEELQQENSLM